MEYMSIKVALEHTKSLENATINGWIRTRRDNKSFVFLEINDGSCLANLQCIIDENTPAWDALTGVNTGACVKITGKLVESLGKEQSIEIHAQVLEVFGLADPETFPLQKKRHSDEYLRTIAHLRPRTNKYGAVLRIRSETAHAIHNFFHELGFFYVHTPILTGADCEGAGEMFHVTTHNPYTSAKSTGNTTCSANAHKNCDDAPLGDCNETPYEYATEHIKLTAEAAILQKQANLNRINFLKTPENDFFGKEANLTVSGQLEGECLATALGKIYTFGPTFRAENSNTPRHAAEFWMVEPEAAFYDLNDTMTLAENLIQYTTKHVLEHCSQDIELFQKFVEPTLINTLNTITEKEFQRVSYRNAIKLLQESHKKFEYKPKFGLDLQTEHERFLAEEYFKSPVIVHDYPKDIKAFYMRMNEDNETVAAMDVLVPRIGELIGGSQREERLDRIIKRIEALGQNPADYWWYLDLRRFGTVPHSGFGLGFERLIMMLTGITNIRDVIPFPRTVGNLEF